MDEIGFKRPYCMPKKVFYGSTLSGLSPRGEFIYQKSLCRARRNKTIYIPGIPSGEIGFITGVRFIES